MLLHRNHHSLQRSNTPEIFCVHCSALIVIKGEIVTKYFNICHSLEQKFGDLICNFKKNLSDEFKLKTEITSGLCLLVCINLLSCLKSCFPLSLPLNIIEYSNGIFLKGMKFYRIHI